jgi:hypothetical protein
MTYTNRDPIWLFMTNECILSNRSQRVVIGEEKSPFLPIRAGVPQGSVLSLLIFLVFIDDLFAEVTNNLDLFADDSTLHAMIPIPSARESVAISLNLDLIAIDAWAILWLVNYNKSKTEALIISTHQDMSTFRTTNPLTAKGHKKWTQFI